MRADSGIKSTGRKGDEKKYEEGEAWWDLGIGCRSRGSLVLGDGDKVY